MLSLNALGGLPLGQLGLLRLALRLAHRGCRRTVGSRRRGVDFARWAVAGAVAGAAVAAIATVTAVAAPAAVATVTAVTAVAAMAAATEETTQQAAATTVAAVATVAAVTAVTTPAAVTTVAAAAAPAAVATEQAGLGRVVHRHRGEANDGQEQGNAQNQNSIHPRNS